MPNNLAHRLSSQDAAFLYLERQHAPLHIGSLGIFEGEIPYDRFLSQLESRMPLIPRYRQRLAFVPFSLLHPTWEDDPDFDISNQLHQISLPPPGSDAQLHKLAAELFAKQLDRSKPLWETYVITGLQHGRSALVSKVHHAMVDGVSGIELLMAILDISPEPAAPPEPQPWNPPPLPNAGERLADAYWDNLSRERQQLLEFQESLIDPLPGIRRGQEIARALSLAAPPLQPSAPRTPFEARLSGQRQVAFADMSFVEIREIRTSLGGTVNDVVLAVLAGALRRYLSAHEQTVDGLEFRVAVPVNVRLDDQEAEMGNRVSCRLIGLPLGEADPIRRLQAIRERQDLLKQENQARGLELLMRLAGNTPTPLQVIAGAAPTSNTLVNMICTNVPGPMIPLYSVGHLMLSHHPLVPLSMDMGLGVGVTSYNHRLYFGLMVDPNAVPDVDVLRQCVEESFFELRAAAGVEISDLPPLPGQLNGTQGAPSPAPTIGAS